MVRRAVLRISAELLAQFLRDGTGMVEVIRNPLPADARIVKTRMGTLDPGLIVLFVESETFAPVDEGGPYPILPDVVFYRTDDGFPDKGQV